MLVGLEVGMLVLKTEGCGSGRRGGGRDCGEG